MEDILTNKNNFKELVKEEKDITKCDIIEQLCYKVLKDILKNKISDEEKIKALTNYY